LPVESSGLIQNSVFHELSNSRENHSLLEEIKIQHLMELGRRNSTNLGLFVIKDVIEAFLAVLLLLFTIYGNCVTN
jgi:hypothetical protein